jgi:hypothetical protein
MAAEEKLGGDDHGGRRNGREGHAALSFVLPANKVGNTRRWRPKEGPVRARHQLARPAAKQSRLRSAATGACHWRDGGSLAMATWPVPRCTGPHGLGTVSCVCAWTGCCDRVRTAVHGPGAKARAGRPRDIERGLAFRCAK